MKVCNVGINVESVDEILWCDHLTSSPVLLHSAIGSHYFTK